MDEETTTATYRMRLAAIHALRDPLGDGLLRSVIDATLKGLAADAFPKQGGIVLGYLLLELLERREAEARTAIGEVLERMAAAGKIGPASEAP